MQVDAWPAALWAVALEAMDDEAAAARMSAAKRRR